MKKILILSIFVISLTIISLAGCKVRIIVPEGGSVGVSSDAYSCASGETCDITVVDFFFDETFMAKPASGYKFKYWKKGPDRLCGWDQEPCRVRTAGLEEYVELTEVILSFLESDKVFYLQPVFEKLVLTGADLSIEATDILLSLSYCERKGYIKFYFLVENSGPATAKDVVVSLEEELFQIPFDSARGMGWWPDYGWLQSYHCSTQLGVNSCQLDYLGGETFHCTTQLGAISCNIGNIIPPSPEKTNSLSPYPKFSARFHSPTFQNKKRRDYRVKITVSSGSADPDLSNNTAYYTNNIQPFPKNNGLCYLYE